MRKRRNAKNLDKLKLIRLILFIMCLSFILYLGNKVNYIVKNQEYHHKEDKVFKSTERKISLIMVGDALIHSAVYADAHSNGKYDFRNMLSEIKPIVSKYDLAFYNQETILGGTELGLSTYPSFNSPYEVGDAFLDAGFNIVSLANNHTLDRGEKAIINSRNYWNSKGVLVNGSATSEKERNDIKIYERNGITYSMIAYTTTTNGINRKKDYFVNIYNKEQVEKDIKKIRSKVDLLMISMHWGEEYYQGITNEQREIANYLSTLGVDIIIGHHPHVIEPIEYMGNTLVIYSLGNFISAQVGTERLTGLMVSLEINKEIVEDNRVVKISNPTAELIYTYSLRGKTRTKFKIYPYSKLNNNLLPNYEKYYNEYMNIVTSKSDKVRTTGLSKE